MALAAACPRWRWLNAVGFGGGLAPALRAWVWRRPAFFPDMIVLQLCGGVMGSRQLPRSEDMLGLDTGGGRMLLLTSPRFGDGGFDYIRLPVAVLTAYRLKVLTCCFIGCSRIPLIC